MMLYVPIRPNLWRGPRRSRSWAALLVAGLILQACSLIPQGESGKPAAETSSSGTPGEELAPEPVDVRAAQRGLLMLGYYQAGIDGVIGPKTRDAVRAFQKDTKRQITGDLSPELVRSIVESAAGARERLSSFLGAAQPVYEAGDRFYYSDGSFESVLSLDGGRVLWESSDGTRRTALWNFVLPPLSWYSEHGSGSTEADTSPDVLWPLKPGTEVRFAVSGTLMESGPNPEPVFDLWYCRVHSLTRTTVPAGTFDTVPITCTVFRQPNGPKRTITWQYAPAVGHYIKRIDTSGDGKETPIELVGVELGGRDWPAAVRTGLDWAFQHALEEESSGKNVQWESSALPGRIEIEALGDVDFGGNAACRRFAATRFDAEGLKRVYPGIACRDADGVWAVPGDQDRARAELP
jgi:putative peptidoglycan binding protein